MTILLQEKNFIHDQSEHSGHFIKSLPRLPSVDDAYDDFGTPKSLTPKAHHIDLPQSPSSAPATPSLGASPADGSELLLGADVTTPKESPLPPLPPNTPAMEIEAPIEGLNGDNFDEPPPIPRKDNKGGDSIHRLHSLRHSFQRTEQSLYALLSRTPVSSLNDARTAFLSAARGTVRRLSAWQKKHLFQNGQVQLTVGDLSVQEPEWWKKSCHAIPGGNIIVREDDWGSIIAFTLKSV